MRRDQARLLEVGLDQLGAQRGRRLPRAPLQRGGGGRLQRARLPAQLTRLRLVALGALPRGGLGMSPGIYSVLPTHAYLTYFPDVFGRSDGGQFTVMASKHWALNAPVPPVWPSSQRVMVVLAATTVPLKGTQVLPL